MCDLDLFSFTKIDIRKVDKLRLENNYNESL